MPRCVCVVELTLPQHTQGAALELGAQQRGFAAQVVQSLARENIVLGLPGPKRHLCIHLVSQHCAKMPMHREAS